MGQTFRVIYSSVRYVCLNCIYLIHVYIYLHIYSTSTQCRSMMDHDGCIWCLCLSTHCQLSKLHGVVDLGMSMLVLVKSQGARNWDVSEYESPLALMSDGKQEVTRDFAPLISWRPQEASRLAASKCCGALGALHELNGTEVSVTMCQDQVCFEIT